jgi:tetratricopeptide (TPR) repeat protein
MFCDACGESLGISTPPSALTSLASEPTSFVGGRYEVKRFLGEGGKKKVYLAHDTKLDRDVAFALIKTEGLNAEGEARIRREAQAMGRLGDHPNIVPVYDIGEEDGQPYLVTQLMGGGDVEGLIEKAPDHRVPLETARQIANQTCQALEYAHAKGIVHRDLKPGNVWLTADGTAKLGDFGLAVALDRSRLTQAGMMVGTVSYMPPEQATGGDVTPRSDLYSLGAMLYELVTGRPPFIGDESVAIIGQHLNTPPVAPSWHRPEVPSALEALILQLLEKDPGRRPASAQEVRAAAAAINLSSLTSTRVETTPPPGGDAAAGSSNPLYRQVFVGRETEVHQLQAAFDAVLAGRGALTTVVGEPGIGKTALCEQLATYVALRGGRTLVGHAYEEGSFSLPYLPFVEALRTYVLAHPPDALREELGSGASDVARLISEIRERLDVAPRPSGGDPEEERWRLLQAVSEFLRNASQVQPLLVVLEDLHWADRGTLDLLIHLARSLQGARLLVVATYRDVEVDRAHPLSGALAELRRASSFGRVLLRGLTADEVQRMMQSITGQEARWSFAEAVHRQTEGNPLFVQEVLRYLVEEGHITHEGGRWHRAGETPPEMHIPEGLRDVIGKRLSQLSPDCNRVLAVAAVIGRDFELETLRQVSELPEEALLDALEQARRVAVLEETARVGVVRYRFAHAFFRQTLYEEMSAPRRLRLHQQVARALETQFASRLDDHAAELAEHFAQSTDAEDLTKAVQYGELAARRAVAVYAYGEGARLLEQAIEVQGVLDRNDAGKRCDLLLALGEAILPSEEPRQTATRVAPEAFALAETLGDPIRAARAAVLALEGLLRAGGPNTPTTLASEECQEWCARADRNAAEGTADRVYADVYLGMSRLISVGPKAGHSLLRRAVERAGQLDEPQAFFLAAAYGLRYLLALRDRETAARLADELLRRPREGARSVHLALGLRFVGDVLLERGDRSGAERAWQDLRELAERTRDATLTVLALGPAATLAMVDGRLEDALAAFEVTDARAEELGVSAGPIDWFRTKALIYLGRGDEALAFFEGPSRPVQAARAMCLAHLGRCEEVRSIRDQFENVGSDEDESGTHLLTDLLDALVLCEDHEAAQALARRLAPLAMYPCSKGAAVSFGRLLGAAAALLGEREQARAYYRQALEACAAISFRPEIALTHLGLAEVLLNEADAVEQSARSRPRRNQAKTGASTAGDLRFEAQGHLDFAIEELRAMKMQPALQRALSHKGLLKA